MGATLSYGVVTVTEQVLAYQRQSGLASHEVLDLEPYDLRPRRSPRGRSWYGKLEPGLLAEDFPARRAPRHAARAEHAQIAVLPLIAMCDRWDIGGLSTNLHPQTGGATIFIYDGHPGGIGITRRGYLAFEALVDDAHRLISECPCEKGCPSCVQSPKCGNLNEPLSKGGAAHLMGRMLAAGS
jgi:DEAD/DEAH box helicase domain-containing protein